MNQFKQIIFIAILTAFFIACKSKSGTTKGSNLKGDDAKAYLAGTKESKYWQLESGHDYYEYIQFETDNGAIIPKGTDITYAVNGDNLTMKDYSNLSYKIYEISDDILVMVTAKQDTLTYIHIDPTTNEAKNHPLLEINPKWLKGQYGTIWSFSTGDKIYSYMNDGRILDAKTLTKIADWKIDGSSLQFGDNKLVISRLSPIFFDYEAFGIPVKMNYLCEARADGKPSR